MTLTDFLLRLSILGALITIAYFIAKVATAILKLHSDVLTFLAEHDIMAEDYILRHDITRHNMRTMALTMKRKKSNGHAVGS